MRKSLLILMGMVILLLGLSIPIMQCAPAAEEEVGAYEKYVASLPEGCFPVPRECFEQAVEEGQVNIYNWAEWFPQEIYDNFSQEFGIKVVLDYFGDYDEMLAKFKLNPETPYDVVIPGTRAMAQLIEMDIWQELNHDWLPNVTAYQTEEHQSVWVEQWQPEGYFKYGVPFDVMFTAYAYNSKYVDDPRIPSWGVILEPNEKYWGKISMMNGMFDTIGAALAYLGYEFNSDNEEELMQARDILLKQKPALAAYEDSPRRLMLEEETWISQAWTGDAWWFHLDNSALRCALPTEGTRVATDGYAIPIGAEHTAAAHLFINYMMRPNVAGALMESIGAAAVHTEAAQYASEELRNWPGMSYPEGYLDRCQVIQPKAYSIGSPGEQLRSQIWEELKT